MSRREFGTTVDPRESFDSVRTRIWSHTPAHDTRPSYSLDRSPTPTFVGRHGDVPFGPGSSDTLESRVYSVTAGGEGQGVSSRILNPSPSKRVGNGTLGPHVLILLLSAESPLSLERSNETRGNRV